MENIEGFIQRTDQAKAFPKNPDELNLDLL